MIVNQRGQPAGRVRFGRDFKRRGQGSTTVAKSTRGPRPDPRMDYDPRKWTSQPDVVFHSSHSPRMPKEGQRGGQGYGPGFHVGTLTSAEDRGWNSTSGLGREREFIHPLQVTGQTALRPETTEYLKQRFPGDYHPDTVMRSTDVGSEEHPLAFSDWDANYTPGRDRVVQGLNVPYVNVHENAGSVSLRAPRENLHTWSEAVLSDPGASAKHRHLARQFDVTIPVKENTRPSRFSGTPAGLVPRPMKFTSVLKSKKPRIE